MLMAAESDTNGHAPARHWFFGCDDQHLYLQCRDHRCAGPVVPCDGTERSRRIFVYQLLLLAD